MLLLTLAPALAGTIVPGTFVDQAASVHVTAQGFDNLEVALAGLLPDDIQVPIIRDALYCDENDRQPLSFTIENLEMGVSANHMDFVLGEGELLVDMELALTMHADRVVTAGRCLVLSANYTCGLDVPANDPILVGLAMSIAIEMDESGVFQVVADEPEITFGTISNPLVNNGQCFLSDIIDDQIRQDPQFFNNLIEEFLGPSLTGLGGDLATPIEEALNGLTLETSLALGQESVDLALAPSEFALNPEGLFLGLGGSATPTGYAPCVQPGEGSPSLDEPWPGPAQVAWDGAFAQDASIVLGKDFIDHLLWNVWATGTLCMEVSDLAGAELGTDLLGNLFGDSFKELFPENKPGVLVVTAAEAPTARFDEEMPLFVDIHGLGLGVAAELDDRQTRIAQVSVDGWIGVNLDLSGTTLAPELVIEPEALVFSEGYTELLAPGYAEGIADFLPTVIGSVLPDDLLPTLSIPTFNGLGLGEVQWQVDEGGAWLGAFALLDIESVTPIALDTSGCQDGVGCSGDGPSLGCDEVLGCGGDSGCDSNSGCEGGGCVTPGKPIRLPAGRIFMGMTLLSLLVLRRRP